MKSFFSHTETELLRLVAAEDQQAFRELFRRYAHLLFPFFVKLTHSKLEAEELIQETMLRIWKNRHKLPELENPRSWLFKVGANQAFTWLKKRSRYNTVELTEELQDEYCDPLSLKELQHNISKAVDELSARRKLIYQMSREKDMKTNEIASQLNISASTVKNSLASALSFISTRIQKIG